MGMEQLVLESENEAEAKQKSIRCRLISNPSAIGSLVENHWQNYSCWSTPLSTAGSGNYTNRKIVAYYQFCLLLISSEALYRNMISALYQTSNTFDLVH